MSVFTTEFPVSDALTRPKLVAETVAWVRGMKSSSVLASPIQENFGDEIRLSSASGERLTVRVIGESGDDITAIRHELPDNNGRLWKTEIVLSGASGARSINVRSQCIAQHARAEVSRPLRPHIIRQIVEEGYGIVDGGFSVSDKAHWANSENLDVISERMRGIGFGALPMVFVSRKNDGAFAVPVDRLAIDLAGIAHVVAEHSRTISFELMAKAQQRNAYGGAIGVYVPEQGEIKRIFPAKNAAWLAREVAISFRSTRELSLGLDWIGALELQSRRFRELHAGDDPSADQGLLALYEEELEIKEEEVSRLRRKVDELEISLVEAASQSNGLIPKELRTAVGPELYEGEFDDRLVRFIALQLDGSSDDLETRTYEVIKRLKEKLSFTGRAAGLIQQVKSAGRDQKSMAKNLSGVLEGFGFAKRETGPHIVFTPPDELLGVSSETLPKTPSDHRAGLNKAQDIIRNLGLSKLK